MRILVSLFALLFTAALSAQVAPPPVETDFKGDICAQCHMAVTSRSYAAQLITGGKATFFDDIGCLVQYEREGKVATAVAARYVRSAAGSGWLAVESAVWVRTADVRTPMGYGLHAFADRQSADAFAAGKKGARVMTWIEVPAQVPEKMGMM